MCTLELSPILHYQLLGKKMYFLTGWQWFLEIVGSHWVKFITKRCCTKNLLVFVLFAGRLPLLPVFNHVFCIYILTANPAVVRLEKKKKSAIQTAFNENLPPFETCFRSVPHLVNWSVESFHHSPATTHNNSGNPHFCVLTSDCLVSRPM